MALLIVGGIALLGALTSKSPKPGAASSGSSAPATAPQTAAQEPYVTIKITGASVRVVATDPTKDGEVLLDGVYNKGDTRPLRAKVVDLTVYDTAAAEVTAASGVVRASKKQQSWRFESGVIKKTW